MPITSQRLRIQCNQPRTYYSNVAGVRKSKLWSCILIQGAQQRDLANSTSSPGERTTALVLGTCRFYANHQIKSVAQRTSHVLARFAPMPRPFPASPGLDRALLCFFYLMVAAVCLCFRLTRFLHRQTLTPASHRPTKACPRACVQQVFDKGGSVASTERCKTWESWECSIKGAGCKLRSIKRMESCARSIESVWRTTSESQGRRVKSVWLVTWKKVKSVTWKAFCKQLDKVKGSATTACGQLLERKLRAQHQERAASSWRKLRV